MGRRKKRIGPPGTDGFSTIGSRTGQGAHGDGIRGPVRSTGLDSSMHNGKSPFVPGVPRGSVPEWGCNCGRNRIWGTRAFCPGCGRPAPDRVQRLQKEAAAKAREAAGKSTAADSQGSNTQGGSSANLAKRLADLEEENRRLRAAAKQCEPSEAHDRPKLPPKTEEEAAGDKEVAGLEDSLAALRTCTHPGKDKQVEDLERHIAFVRSEAHKRWSPARVRQRLVARLDDARHALEKTSGQQKELAEQQAELTKRVAEAEERASKQAATVAERQAALDACDQANPTSGGAPESVPAASRSDSPVVPDRATGPGGPSWHEYQQRIVYLCRTGLPLEVAMQQAADEAASPSGLRAGRVEDLELQDQGSDNSGSDGEDDDIILGDYVDPGDTDATFTRAQMREILARQKGRVQAAAKKKQRTKSGSVRQPAFAKK